MKNSEIIVETEDGAIIQIKCGETFVMDNGQKITYEQLFKWILEGSLKQHGFRPHKVRAFKSHCVNDNYVARSSKELLTIAAVTAAR